MTDLPPEALTAALLAYHKAAQFDTLFLFVYGKDGEVIGGSFVAALAAAVPVLTARGAAEEREACAQLAEQQHATYGDAYHDPRRPFADLIRARTPKETTP